MGLSDDDDDEEIFNTHRDEMVQYMIDIYRRKQNVIEEYENKRAVSILIFIKYGRLREVGSWELI